MWSRFEKLKDNITQIASDVLDSQDDDDEIDGEGVLDDDSLDEHYNAPQSLYLRDRDSDGEEGSPVFRPKEVCFGLLFICTLKAWAVCKLFFRWS